MRSWRSKVLVNLCGKSNPGCYERIPSSVLKYLNGVCVGSSFAERVGMPVRVNETHFPSNADSVRLSPACSGFLPGCMWKNLPATMLAAL